MSNLHAEMNSLWQTPPEPLILASDQVHAWRARLSCPDHYIDAFLRVLAEDERDRVARFHFKKDRDHFIAARGMLRATLARYLGVEPQQLRFDYSSFGKPSLAESFRKDDLRFNVSHSHDLALFGMSYGRELGVDLEYMRDGVAGEQIAEHFFSPREVHALRALPKAMQDHAFFNCWTRKEAYIKAIGEGLSMPLHLFDVSLAPGEPAALLSISGDQQELSQWELRELFPGPGFVGAVAARGQGWGLKCWEWEMSDFGQIIPPA